jgi:ribosomal protein L32E
MIISHKNVQLIKKKLTLLEIKDLTNFQKRHSLSRVLKSVSIRKIKEILKKSNNTNIKI